jgi:PAS domain S-box-containing protein
MKSFPGWLKTILALVVLALLAGGVWFYQVQERRVRQDVETHLKIIAELKADQIAAWRANQLGEANELMASLFFAKGVAQWLANPQTETPTEILSRFRSLQEHYHYLDVLLVDAGGRARLSLSGQIGAVATDEAQAVSAALRDHKPVLTDLHADLIGQKPHIGVAAPLFVGEGETQKPVGVVIFESEARQLLYPLIQSWPVPSKTAETLLVRREGGDVVFLNDLRHKPDTALKYRTPLSQTNMPSVMAVLGKEGVVDGKDYRGVEVLAALKHIPDSPWFMVAKVDTAEAFALWRFRSILILALLLALIASACACVLVVWQRNQKDHYRALYRAEAARLASEKRHGVTLKSIGDAVIATDAKGYVELLNPVAEMLTGWRQEEACGKPLEEVFRIINEDTREPVENPVRCVMRAGVVVGLANHTSLIARDGTERPIADAGAPIRDERNGIIGVVLVFRDRTEERALQRALQKSEEHFRGIFEKSPVGFQSHDLEGHILDVNPAWLALLGYSRGEVVGHSLEDFFTPASRVALAEQFPRFREQGLISGSEFEMRRQDGVILTVAIDGVFVRDEQGRPHHTQCVFHNITDRKRAEAALRDSEEKFRSVAEQSPNMIFINRGGRVVFANAKCEELMGYLRAEFYSPEFNFRDLIAADYMDAVNQAFGKHLKGEEVLPYEYALVTKAGERIEAIITTKLIRYDGENAILGIITNITERKRTEAALRESEERYRLLFEGITDGVFVHGITDDDLPGQFLALNDTICRWLGYTREELLRLTVRDIDAPESTVNRQEIVAKLKSGQKVLFEQIHVAKDGRRIQVEINAQLFQMNGRPAIFSVIRDITERKRAELALEESRRMLRSVLDTIPVRVFWKDVEGRYLGCNQPFARDAGLDSPAALTGKNDFDMAWKDQAELYRADDQRVIASGVPKLAYEEPQTSPTGAQLWLRTSKIPVRDLEGRIIGILGTYEDITERKRAEDELHHRNEEVAALNTLSREVSSSLSPETVVDSALRELLAAVKSDLVFLFLREGERLILAGVEPKTSRERLGQIPEHRLGECMCGLAVELGTPLYSRNIFNDPRCTWEECKQAGLRSFAALPLHVGNEIIGVIGLASDTERDFQEKAGFLETLAAAVSASLQNARLFAETKRAEEEIARVAREWQTTFDATNDAIWILDQNHRVLRTNKIAERIFKRPLVEMVGKYCHEIVHGTTEPIPGCPLARARLSLRRETTDMRIGWNWFEIIVDPILDSAGYYAGAVHIVSDITARKQAEERIREQAALLDAANDAIYVRSLEQMVTYWNDGAERLYGWTRAEVMGRKIHELVLYDPAAFEAAHGLLLAQDSWIGELKMTSKTGKEFIVFCRWTLLRDDAGQPKEVLAINTDITEQKRLETNFLRAQRLEGIGALASGIAHDLNNILTPILVSAPLIRETVSDPEGRALLDTMQNCARRGADIIKQLLTFARGEPGVRVPLPLRHLLRDMGKIIHETFPKNIQLNVESSKDLWLVLGDATQIHQALMNLCVNARDAMPRGGTLALKAENLIVDEAFTATTSEAKPGPYVCLSAADTGMGIASKNLEHIFDPFFTTKGIGEGTGLGLATVLGIVRGHGGFVRVNSRVGQGATFQLFLPAVMEAKPAAAPDPEKLPPRADGELILVVDDETAVLQVIEQTLKKHGYRVITANEGTGAMALFAQHQADIKVVVTDMMMPGMDGPALVQALRHLKPRLPILGMTGLAERASLKGLRGLGLPKPLIKPFAGEELLTALSRALTAPVNQPKPRGKSSSPTAQG